MSKLTQYQIALLAFLAGGVIVILVFVLTSGGGDGDDDQAANRTPTAMAVASGTPGDEATATSTSAAPDDTATAPPAPAATTAPTVVPPLATATSPPPTATSTTPPTATATPTPTPTPTLTPTATVVTGIWHGTWQTNCSPSNCGEMNLVQLGNIVVGTYAGGEGTIDGVVTGNRLSGTWSRNAISGSIDFWVDGSGDGWQGNFGSLFSSNYGWCGRRVGEAYPTPCGVASWYGTWTTNCGFFAACGAMTLHQDGATVTGTYAGGAGLVSGTVNGATLSGTWIRGGTGPLTFTMLPNGNQFNGNFGGTNAWCGFRNAAGDPVPCLN